MFDQFLKSIEVAVLSAIYEFSFCQMDILSFIVLDKQKADLFQKFCFFLKHKIVVSEGSGKSIHNTIFPGLSTPQNHKRLAAD